MNYSCISDIVVCIISILMLILLRTTYLTKTKCLLLLKLGLFNIVYCSLISQWLYGYLIPKLGKVNIFLIYTGYNILHIGYIFELALFLFYMYELINFHNKLMKIGVVSLVCIYTILELTSVFTHISFWIDEDNTIHNNGTTSLYLVWYIIMITIFLATIIIENRVIVNRIYQSIFAIFSFCIFLTIFQFINSIESFTTLSLLLPVIVIVFLFHSNSYNSSYGALDGNALRGRLQDLIGSKHQFNFIYIQIPNFTNIEYDVRTAKDFNTFTKLTGYKDYLFRYDTDIFVMLYDSKVDVNCISDFFNKLHTGYQLTHKIIVVKSNSICKDLNDYIEVCNLVLNKMSYSFYEVTEKDLDRFSKGIIIKRELADIELKGDLDDSRVKVFCQPILDIDKKVFTTAESLMRLELDDLGIVYPDLFIPIAESEGKIHTLTLIILNKVCQFIEKNPEITRVSVNFSMYEITKSGFYNDIIGVVSKYNIDYTKLGFEVTESLEADDFDTITEVLTKFSKLGIKLYLDDFGTGYSNIEHITKLPIDIIKFDRSLVIASGKDDMSNFMVGNLSNMFDIIGYSILYEGIENKSDQDRCINMKACYLQGYRYSRPIPIEELPKFINQPFNS